MTLTKIGSEQWDFVDATGTETRLPEGAPEARAVNFPTRWRVFGPLQGRVDVVGVERVEDKGANDVLKDLRGVPHRLAIGDETLQGQDVVLDGDTIDLGKSIGGYETIYFSAPDARLGQQAYAFAELELSEETEVAFGAGADYWMQWWIDGEPAFDTLDGGNRVHPPSRTDHSFCRRLPAGKHLLAVRLISGQSSWVLRAGALTPREETLARVTLSDSWQFLPDLNEIRPATRGGSKWIHTMAIAADRCLAEETIECEFQLPGDGNFGIILGAQDSGHYYCAHVPRWGQLWRARGFWAAISRADGSGYIRNLKMALMSNVVCHGNSWLKLRVERRGNQIQMWINGVKGPRVTDDTYGPGRVGLEGFSKYTVRDLKIDGKPVAGPEWKEGDCRGRPWFNIDPDPNLGDVQAGAGPLLKLAADEIIMAMLIGRDTSCPGLNATNSATHFYSSRDGGRSWSRYGTATEGIPGPWFAAAPGLIRALQCGQTEFAFTFRDSTDKGLTWSKPRGGQLLGDWRRDILRDGTWNALFGFAQLNDGTLLGAILHGYKDLAKIIPNHGQGTWGAAVAQPYCTLSRDQGLSWSEPVPMDNAALNDGDKPDGPCGGFSEISVAQLPGGRIVALARPFNSPFMWQTHSEDGCKTWRMACYAPFSGAGGPQLVATRSGYLVSIKRGPGLGLHFSTDGGLNWDEGTMIDLPTSFNGSAIEAEPDVVLVVYPQCMDEIRPSYVRAQLIRMTPEGPEPIIP